MEHIQIVKDAFEIYATQYRSLGDYSATSLIDPPRKVQLTKRYGHLVKPTIESMVAAMVGTSVHEKMEELLKLANVKNPDYLLERSLVHPFWTGPDGVEQRLVAGRFDILYKEKDLYDIKTVKTWKTIFDPEMKDWHQQQNIYAYLLFQRGITIESLNIVAFYLDWIESNAIRDRHYPQAPLVQYKLTLWPWEQTAKFIDDRLAKHVAAEYEEDDNLPKCTMEERWERSPEYAIMKNAKAKRATKVLRDEGTTFDQAVQVARSLSGLGADSYIEVRHKARKRCDKYCRVNGYCNLYKAYAQKREQHGLNEIFPLKDLL